MQDKMRLLEKQNAQLKEKVDAAKIYSDDFVMTDKITFFHRILFHITINGYLSFYVIMSNICFQQENFYVFLVA